MTSERIPIQQARLPLFAGVDVGGTNIKIGLVDDLGRILGQTKLATEEALGPESAVHRSSQAINELLRTAGAAAADLAAVGLGTPGSMDIPRGLILEPPNLPHWRHFAIRDRLAEACGRRVAFANDANAAAFGEFWVGSGASVNSLVMFTLGTGVGGGIILDGRSLDGEHSFGSELGHLVVDSSPTARHCVWGGGLGQLEAYASASAVTARASELLAAGRESTVVQRVDQGAKLTAKLLFEEAEQGDEFSLEVILEAARYLGLGVVSIVHAIDPGAVVIGGAMTFGGHGTVTGRRFLAAVRSEFQRLAFDIVRTVPIDYARLGSEAGFIGAAGLAREMHHRG